MAQHLSVTAMNLFPHQQHQQPQPLQPQAFALDLERNPPQKVMLYAVQRCWHSGPIQYQPLDLLRLFHSQRDAEEAAYHSAHAWARHRQGGSSSNSSNSVKTLLLPSYPRNNPQGSSYGFVSDGTLFWVRALQANVATVGRHHNNAICHTEAYAVLTGGVIGGTGNRNSRRGTEECTGRVFGGDASSLRPAVEALRGVQAALQQSATTTAGAGGGSGPPPLQARVATLPIGKPAEYSSGDFLRDWPEEVLLQPPMVLADRHEPSKRGAAAAVVGPATDWVHIRGSGSGSDDSRHSGSGIDENDVEGRYDDEDDVGMVVDCPFEMPTAKRRRIREGGPDFTTTPCVSTTGGGPCSLAVSNVGTGSNDIMGLSGHTWQQQQHATPSSDDVAMM